MEFKYNVEDEIKQEFLNTKPTQTAQSEAYILRSADEYEELIKKSIYNMTYAELKEMFAMQFKNSSISTILKNISILKTYVDFCIDKKIVEHGENRLSTFTIKEAKEFAHRQALLNKFITKEKIKEYQNILYNEQDKLFIELPYLGIRGRTVRHGTLEEIINLSIDDIDEGNRMLTLTQNNGKHRRLEVELSTIELIKDAFKQTIYVENNGEETDNPRFSKPRESIINKIERYIFRVPGKNKFQKFNSNLLNSRMKRIQKYLDNPYISFTSLYQSGMIELALDIYKEKGIITKDDYIEICDRYNFGSGDPEKYWYKVKDLSEQYIELLM
jgi:integrase